LGKFDEDCNLDTGISSYNGVILLDCTLGDDLLSISSLSKGIILGILVFYG